MNTVAYASLAFLIVSMLACSFVISRGRRTRSRKVGDTLPILSIIILLDMIISVVIFFVHIVWKQYVPWYPIVLYLAMINLSVSFVTLFETLLPEEPPATQKYLVKRISGSGSGSVVVSEQDYQDLAIYDACQLAKKNKNAVFVVIDKHGNRIATINHSGVSVQMHNKPFFGF